MGERAFVTAGRSVGMLMLAMSPITLNPKQPNPVFQSKDCEEGENHDNVL